MDDVKATKVSKILAIVFGVICFGLVFVAMSLDNVLEAALSIFGIIGGPLLGVFTLGMFFPWANAIVSFASTQILLTEILKISILQGAGVGIITSLIFMLWIGVGTQVAKAQGYLKLVPKPYSIEGCTNATLPLPPSISPLPQ